MALLLLGAVVVPAAAGSRNLARGMVHQDDTLLLEAPSGPVRIALDKNQPLLERLLPGMSVVTKIHTGEAGTDGGK